jgi:hypothetical protein
MLLALVHTALTSAQDAAPPDRTAVNTAVRPGGMLADSPVTSPSAVLFAVARSVTLPKEKPSEYAVPFRIATR